MENYLKLFEDSGKAAVQVNGEKYTYSGFSIGTSDQYKYTVSDNETNGTRQYLDLSINGFTAGKNTVTIEAEGCDKNGEITDSGSEEPPAGLLTAPEAEPASLYNSRCYRVSFTGLNDEELRNYLKALADNDKTEIEVNGQKYQYSSWLIMAADKQKYTG